MEVILKKQIVLKPVISEKSLHRYRNDRICTFVVKKDSTKSEIAYYFKKMFEVDPVNVRTVVTHDTRKVGSYKTGRKDSRKYVKKAYINIGENKLDIFENIK